ncbi:MAG: hypothetical protein O3C65_04795 [Proteobacteria bacterium]|nr:hypothetical protein [Pseudomonadota bacterium]MDA1057986.1 hypothetical protein [Pseudomonadota bacterium]
MTFRVAEHLEAALVTLLACSTLGPGVALLGLLAVFASVSAGETVGLLPGGWIDTHLATIFTANALIAFPVVAYGAVWWYSRSLRAVRLHAEEKGSLSV